MLQVDRAIHEYIRCTALTRIVHGNSHWKLAKSHVDLGEAYLDLKGQDASPSSTFGSSQLFCFSSLPFLSTCCVCKF